MFFNKASVNISKFGRFDKWSFWIYNGLSFEIGRIVESKRRKKVNVNMLIV